MSDDENVINLMDERLKRDPKTAAHHQFFEEVQKVASALASIMIRSGTMHLIIADEIGKFDFIFEMKIAERKDDGPA